MKYKAVIHSERAIVIILLVKNLQGFLVLSGTAFRVVAQSSLSNFSNFNLFFKMQTTKIHKTTAF